MAASVYCSSKAAEVRQVYHDLGRWLAHTQGVKKDADERYEGEKQWLYEEKKSSGFRYYAYLILFGFLRKNALKVLLTLDKAKE